ncbi:MAG: type VI secretion protein IcmF/TssM N-terminal domain-containing protein [Pirellulales bacterium]
MDELADSNESSEQPEALEAGALQQGCLSRLTPVTPPGCAGCLTAVLLIFALIIAVTVFLLDQNSIPWRYAISWWRIALVIGLLIAIPVTVRSLVRIWIRGEESLFPDLDYAWTAGLHALASNGLSVRSIPIYLVLGSRSEQQEKSLFVASGVGMRVEGVPAGPASIHWYANPDGIYICCSDASWCSGLASLREELMTDAAGIGQTYGADRKTAVSLPAASPSPAGVEPGANSDDLSGTMLLDQFLVPAAPSEMPPDNNQSELEAGPEHNIDEDVMLAAPTEPVVLSQQYSTGSLQELQYLCKLLKQIREPICCINGVVSLVQLEAIHGTGDEMDELYKAIRGDLETIQYATQVKAPITTLIVGMERERGFRELLRRVGKERARVQRFGKRYDVQVVPDAAQMLNLSAHVCGAFEDWCYTLFREEKSLSRPGNTKLYELLAKVRLGWKSRLGEILKHTVGTGETSTAADPPLYCGCYVAACGETPDRQGFVKGFLDKLKDEQEFVEWTDLAIQQDKARKKLIKWGLGSLVALVLSFALILLSITVLGG